MPGLVDAHNHLALTYKEVPERNSYYLTSCSTRRRCARSRRRRTEFRCLRPASRSCATWGTTGTTPTSRCAQAIEQGWIPGPTIIPSGLIIGGMGGQFSPTPEMAKDHKIVYPEYLEADTPDEIVKAVRQNALFGARVIKICVDCKPWGYTIDEIRLVIREAAKAGLKVEGHVQTVDGGKRAVEAGIWSIAHDNGMTDEIHKQMAQKGVWRAGTETPISLTGHTNPQRYTHGRDAARTRGRTRCRSRSRPTPTTTCPARRAAKSRSSSSRRGRPRRFRTPTSCAR